MAGVRTTGREEVISMPKFKVTIKVLLDGASKAAVYSKAAELVPEADYIAVDEDKTATTNILGEAKKQLLGK
jgi:hypothetical protein